MTDTNQKSSNPILKIALAIILVLLVGTIIYRLLGVIVVLLLLFINRDLVKKIYGKIIQLYQKNMVYGIGATIAAFLLFTPFTVFLFFRTVYHIFTGKKLDKQVTKEAKTIIDITPKETKKNTTPRSDGLMTIEEIRAKLRNEENR